MKYFSAFTKALRYAVPLAFAVLIFTPSAPARAAAQFCFCKSDLAQLSPTDPSYDLSDVTKYNFICFPQPVVVEQCTEAEFKKLYPNMQNVVCSPVQMQQECQQTLPNQWKAAFQTLYAQRKDIQYTKNLQMQGGQTPIPPCALQDVLTTDCRDISVLVVLLINFGRFLLAGIGAWALIFFIYGGFTLVLSAGNPEKVKQGTDTMLAALIGIFIAFAAYMLIRFLGQALNIKSSFQL